MALSPNQAIALGIEMVKRNLPLLLVGSPGCGKTDIGHAIRAALERKLFLFHPVIDAPEDYKGFPMFFEGKADFFPLGMLRELLECEEPAIMFIDDLGQAPMAVQAAMMQWIHPRNRQLSGKKLPDNVAIIAASNRREDNAGVMGFLDPVKDRWTSIVEVDVSLSDWTNWAASNLIDPRIISYLHLRPDNLNTFTPSKGIERTATPRAWEAMHNMLQIAVPKGTELDVYTGIVGKSIASEFFEFLAVEKELPDPEAIENGYSAKVPDQNNVRYAIMAALSHRGTTEPSLENIIKYVLRFPGEYRKLWEIMFSKRSPEMMKTGAWGTWVKSTAKSRHI